MKTILSIQSHVAYGYVGNRAATFPLQRLGYNVVVINTVQFSNHTGYGEWTGDVFSADHIRKIAQGLKARGVLDKVDALLTGYMGDASIGEVILEIADSLPPHAVWLCDPVMGDVGRGFFVREGIPAFFKEQCLPRAHIMTPNRFELEYLTGLKIETLNNLLESFDILHERGVDTVLCSSLCYDNDLAKTEGKETIWMGVSQKNNSLHRHPTSKSSVFHAVGTPLVDISPAPNGAGDLTAALFLSNMLSEKDFYESLRNTAGSLFAVFQKTKASGGRELALIESQDDFANPNCEFIKELA